MVGGLVAIDVTSYLASRTGVGVCVRELVRALLAAAGKDGERRFKLCALSSRSGVAEELSAAFPSPARDVAVRRLPMRLAAPLADLGGWFTLERMFGPSDVFHAGPLLIPATRTTPIVASVYDLTPILFPEYHLSRNRLTRARLRRRLDRADLLIVPSASTGADLQRFLSVPPHKVRVVPLAASACFRPLAQEQREDRPALGLGEDFILAVGSLEPRKNLPRLFRAFRILKDRHRIPHKLVVAGPDGWMVDAIYRSVRDLNLAGEVIFTGFVTDEDLNLLYNDAALLVYPSLYEGFGLPPLEAMAAGCPMAVSRVSSLPEVVGDAGLYFDPTQEEEIAETVFQILSCQGVRRNLSALGMRRSAEFSWEKTAQLTSRIYCEAAQLR